MKSISFIVSDPCFKKSINVDVKKCKTVQNLKEILTTNLGLNDDQFIIDQITNDTKLSSIDEKYVFQIKILNSSNDINFLLPDSKTVKITKCSKSNISSVIKVLQTIGLFFSDNFVQNSLSFHLWGIKIPFDGFHLKSIPENVNVEVKFDNTAITLDYDQKKFIFSENEQVGTVISFLKKQYKSKSDFYISKEPNTGSLNNEYKLKKSEKYKIKNKRSPSDDHKDEKETNEIIPVKFSNITFLSPELINQIKPQLKIKKRLLGEGSTSFVYKVNCINDLNEYDEKSKTFLALKIIKKSICEDPKASNSSSLSKWDEDDDDGDDDDVNDDESEMKLQINFKKIKKFFQEYELIINLQHPNIIKSFGFYNGDETMPPCILLEYFKHNLNNSISLLEDVYLVSIIYEICVAMEFVHKHGLIHLDLKPTNILLDNEKHVKICDFGIATLIPTGTITTSQTTTFGGTRGFIAPELFQSKKYNEKVDVYSFGVVMHFILTRGEIPEINLVDAVINKKMKLSSKINKISNELICKCLSILPDERPNFTEIIKFIKNKKMMLVDGIDNTNSILCSHLKNSYNLTANDILVVHMPKGEQEEAVDEPQNVIVNIRELTGSVYKIEIQSNATISMLKEKYSQMIKSKHGDIPPEFIVLIYRAIILHDDQTISSLKIEKNVYIVAHIKSGYKKETFDEPRNTIVNIRELTGSVYKIEIQSNATISMLKDKYSQMIKSKHGDIPPEFIVLIYKAIILHDDQTISSLKIEKNVYIVAHIKSGYKKETFDAPKNVIVNIRELTGSVYRIEIQSNATISMLKDKYYQIIKLKYGDIPPESIKLIHKALILHDDQTISSLQIDKNEYIVAHIQKSKQ